VWFRRFLEVSNPNPLVAAVYPTTTYLETVKRYRLGHTHTHTHTHMKHIYNENILYNIILYLRYNVMYNNMYPFFLCICASKKCVRVCLSASVRVSDPVRVCECYARERATSDCRTTQTQYWFWFIPISINQTEIYLPIAHSYRYVYYIYIMYVYTLVYYNRLWRVCVYVLGTYRIYIYIYCRSTQRIATVSAAGHLRIIFLFIYIYIIILYCNRKDTIDPYDYLLYRL